MSRVEFHLEFQENFLLKQQMLLRLRRELAGVARSSADELLINFINPGLPDDPYARKIFQKPTPPFVIQASDVDDLLLEAGDSFVLKALFFGNLGIAIGCFASLLQKHGDAGFFKGEGRYELDMVVGRDQAGNQQLLWRGGDLPEEFTAQQISLLWHVEDCLVRSNNLSLDFLTPARLLSDGKPLFNPAFIDIFPFILRRVTSILYFWADMELSDDPQDLLSLAGEVTQESSDLSWRDWREMDNGESRQELGGLLGTIHFGQIESEKLITILLLGELLHIGRGAAYGAGEYRLEFEQ